MAPLLYREILLVDSLFFFSFAANTQNLEHVLLGVQIRGITLDVLANNGDWVQFEHFYNETGDQFTVVIVH